jgi:hypothetical protein
MTIKEAREILVRFNEWRRYDSSLTESPRMENPKEIGIAIDTVVNDVWISLKDRKPELDQECIIFNGKVMSGFIYNKLGSFHDNSEGLYFIVDATNWMPLPEQPSSKEIGIAIDTVVNLETFSKDDINNAYQKGYDDGSFDATH